MNEIKVAVDRAINRCKICCPFALMLKLIGNLYASDGYKMQKLTTLDVVALILLVIGGLNWGLVALGYNAVDMILGSWPVLVNLVYLLVGVSALYIAWLWMKLERK